MRRRKRVMMRPDEMRDFPRTVEGFRKRLQKRNRRRVGGMRGM